MWEWSDALGGSPFSLRDDRAWVLPILSATSVLERGRAEAVDSVTSFVAVAHFPAAPLSIGRRPASRRRRFCRDALQVVMDRRHVAFMYSYPNYIPSVPATSGDAVRLARLRVRRLRLTWGRNIIGGGERPWTSRLRATWMPFPAEAALRRRIYARWVNRERMKHEV